MLREIYVCVSAELENWSGNTDTECERTLDRWTDGQMDRRTDRHDHRLTDHVGLAQARPK